MALHNTLITPQRTHDVHLGLILYTFSGILRMRGFDMSTLMENFERTTLGVQSPVARKHALRLIEGLADLPIEVLGVAQVRKAFPQLRHRVQKGAIALVANRGEVANEKGTTVMISLEGFNALFLSLIERSLKLQSERTSPAEILMGLRPVPSLSAFEVNFNALTHGHSDQELAGLSL